MVLHVITDAEPPPLPDPPTARHVRRPGERHEAIAVSEAEWDLLRDAARQAGIPADLAATLLVEARLVVDWLHSLRIAPAMLRAPATAVALSAAEADYLRTLTVGRRLGGERLASASPGIIALPVRLLSRCSPSLLQRAAGGDLERAIGWEVSALRAGLNMGEWAARAAATALATVAGCAPASD